MKIELHKIKVKDVINGYVDSGEEGVVGYGGRLNIRPKYQREFVYDDKKRNAVIDTIMKGFPLNVMYWAKNEDGSFEVLDGQQRTLSFCQYCNSDFSIKIKHGDKEYDYSFHNLTKDEQSKILNYELLVYFCEGNDREKLDWFRVINIAGEKLTDQELRNATYTGEWLTHAKSIFSKSNCAAYNLSKDYIVGSAIRQQILETALDWISRGNIEVYMASHQHAPNANELWIYFQNVINWVQLTFPKYRKEMKGIEWGWLYDDYHTKIFNTTEIEEEIAKLMIDRDVTNNKGIYPYVLTREEKHLNIRAFDLIDKRIKYEEQKGICPVCKQYFEIEQMEADHIIPWSEGGKTELNNCQMLCKSCNRMKSNK